MAFCARARRSSTGIATAAPPLIFRSPDHRNRKFSLSDHAGKVVLLNFGFTNCPDICPTTLGMLGEVLDLVGDNRAMALFITVDPERDTVSRLGDYIPFFHDRIVGLTGPEQAIKRGKRCLRHPLLQRSRRPLEDDYLVIHSPAVYLVGPGGEILLRYPKEKLHPEKIADDVKRLLL